MSTRFTILRLSGAMPTKRSVMVRVNMLALDDGDGFCEVHVNTIEGFWSLLRSWLRPHRGISQQKLPLYLGFFEFVHNVKKRGKALLNVKKRGKALLSALLENLLA